MKKHLIITLVVVFGLAVTAWAADKAKLYPIGSQIVSVKANAESNLSIDKDAEYIGGWLNVSKGSAIRYYPYGTSGVTPYGAFLEVYDSYWIESLNEMISCRFHTDADSGSGSSVFFTPYKMR